MEKDNEFFSIHHLPPTYRGVFNSLLCSKLDFNLMQAYMMSKVIFYKKHITTKVAKAIYQKNMVISAPTGSGKTLLMELAIVDVLISKRFDPLAKEKNPIQIYYITTNQSLVNDKYRDWNEKFSYLNITCGYNNSKAHINLMTARQWYKLMLKSRQNTLDRADLLLVDEIHQIEDSFHGYLFEVGISYSKVYTEMSFQNAINVVNESIIRNCRIIAVSATISNVVQFSGWLNADNFVFDDSYRSTQLKSVFCELESINTTPQFFAQSKSLSLVKLREFLQENNPNLFPTLVFVPSIKKVKECCLNVVTWCPSEVLNENDESLLREITQNLNNSSLRATIEEKRVAFHTSDLSLNDQKIVEYLMKKGCLRIVFSTTTLAVGTNFPIFMSIVCTTAKYENNQIENNLETYKIEQMIGRAGRKGHELDTGYSFNFGIGAIMSSNSKYKNPAKVEIESALYKSVQSRSFQIVHILFDIISQLDTITDTCLTKIIKTTFCKSYTYHSLSNAIDKLVQQNLIKTIKDNSRDNSLPLGDDNESLFTITAITKFFESESIGYENIMIILSDLNNEKDDVLPYAKDKPFQYITTNGHGSFIAQMDLIVRFKEFSYIEMPNSDEKNKLKLDTKDKNLWYCTKDVIHNRERKIIALLQLDLSRRTVDDKLCTFDGNFAYLNVTINDIYRIGKTIIAKLLKLYTSGLIKDIIKESRSVLQPNLQNIINMCFLMQIFNTSHWPNLEQCEKNDDLKYIFQNTHKLNSHLSINVNGSYALITTNNDFENTSLELLDGDISTIEKQNNIGNIYILIPLNSNTKWFRYPAYPQLNLDIFLKLDIGQIENYKLIQSVNFNDNGKTAGKSKILKGYFDLIRETSFEQHNFCANFHRVIDFQSKNQEKVEMLNYPTRIIDKKHVQERVQCGKCKYLNGSSSPELCTMLNCFANIPHIYKFFLNGDDLPIVDYNQCFGAQAHKFADYIRVYWNRTAKQINLKDLLEKELESDKYGFKFLNSLEDCFVDQNFSQFYAKIIITASYIKDNNLTDETTISHTLTKLNNYPNIIIAINDGVQLTSTFSHETHRIIGIVVKTQNNYVSYNYNHLKSIWFKYDHKRQTYCEERDVNLQNTVTRLLVFTSN